MVEKILNKRKVREVEKYLVHWKRFTAEHNTWKKEKNLGNIREALEEFEEKINVEIRWQKKTEIAEEKDFRRGELPGKFIARMLYRWDDRKFKGEYLKKLEKNWQK